MMTAKEAAEKTKAVREPRTPENKYSDLFGAAEGAIISSVNDGKTAASLSTLWYDVSLVLKLEKDLVEKGFKVFIPRPSRIIIDWSNQLDV